jgi:hypothetical protein
MLKIFRIVNTGSKRIKKGHDLFGLLIMQTDTGFYLVAPESGDELAKTKFLNISGPPFFSFDDFNHKGNQWNLIVDQALPDIQNPETLKGAWQSPPGVTHVGPAQDEDSWTASSTGKGVPGDEDQDEDQDDARAASAY